MKKIMVNIIENVKFVLSIILTLIGSAFILGACNLIEYLAKKSYGIILLILFTISLFLTIFFTDGWLNIICFLLFAGWCFICFVLMMLYSLGEINKANAAGEDPKYFNNDLTEADRRILEELNNTEHETNT